MGQSETSGDDLQRELARISALSSNTVQIDAENRQLKQALAETEQWRVIAIGGPLCMFGILVGLILPRIRWKKKSSWGEL